MRHLCLNFSTVRSARTGKDKCHGQQSPKTRTPLGRIFLRDRRRPFRNLFTGSGGLRLFWWPGRRALVTAVLATNSLVCPKTDKRLARDRVCDINAYSKSHQQRDYAITVAHIGSSTLVRAANYSGDRAPSAKHAAL